jgi:hypothetical protein
MAIGEVLFKVVSEIDQSGKINHLLKTSLSLFFSPKIDKDELKSRIKESKAYQDYGLSHFCYSAAILMPPKKPK